MSAPGFEARPLRPWHLGLLLVASSASTMCGIGGGLFAVPILHFLLGLPLKLATATSLVAVFAMTLSGTLTEASHAGNALDWSAIGLLSAGALLGAALGQRVNARINPQALTWVFAAALLIGGARVLATSMPADVADAPTLIVVTPLSALWLVAAGFGGGFVAPILGIGGGLIVVPALFLGIPGTSYLTARACSTAMSVVASAQLTWLNLRAGRVHRPSMLPFAAVTICGGWIGTSLVHLPGWSHGARIMLGVLMLALSAKYTWRAARHRAQ